MNIKQPIKKILILHILGFAIAAHSHFYKRQLETGEWQQTQNTEGTTELHTAPSNHIGYAGETPLKILLSEDNKIIGVSFLPNSETHSFIKRIENSGFMKSWNGLTVIEAINKPVDAISGATMTTQCVINTLRDDLTERVKTGEIAGEGKIIKAGKSWYHYFRTVASLLVLGFALASFFFPKKMNPFRLYLLALSVIVLGFWQGQYLSVTHFFNMVANGINWTVWFIPLLVLLAFALPLITQKSFYCMYVCPFGAAQELVSKLNKKRIHIPQKAYKILIYLRPLYLLVIIGLLFANVLSDFVDFEPFAAFMLNVNLWIPTVIAGTFLLASIFSPRFWCKYCCPTGYVINMCQTSGRKK